MLAFLGTVGFASTRSPFGLFYRYTTVPVQFDTYGIPVWLPYGMYEPVRYRYRAGRLHKSDMMMVTRIYILRFGALLDRLAARTV